MPPEVLKEFEERTGATVVEGYGMTEASPVTHVNPYSGTRKIGSVGLAIPNTEYKIVDIDDYTKIMPQGESGEIMIKGPQVMKGYWNKPEETENQLKDGWLLTGDIGRMDDDGYLFIVDRKKDMIIISGFKVYPRELEDVLFEHEAIENVAIIGLPDPEIPGSEKVKAYIVLKDGYREKVHLTTKLPMWSVKTTEDFDKFLNEQIERLQTNPDIYLFHGLNKERLEKIKTLNLIEKMEQAKAGGLIKHIGFSFHDSRFFYITSCI